MTSFPILSNKEKKELIQLANEAADRAREAILPYFRKNKAENIRSLGRKIYGL